ncbi:MAG: hypothetical protein ACI8S6_001694, partial [Myxococcota bacterium]
QIGGQAGGLGAECVHVAHFAEAVLCRVVSTSPKRRSVMSTEPKDIHRPLLQMI